MEKSKYNFLLSEDRNNDINEIDLAEFSSFADYTPEADAEDQVSVRKGPVRRKTRKDKSRVIRRKGKDDYRRVEIRVPFDVYMAMNIIAKVEKKSLQDYLSEMIDKELCNEKDRIVNFLKLLRQ